MRVRMLRELSFPVTNSLRFVALSCHNRSKINSSFFFGSNSKINSSCIIYLYDIDNTKRKLTPHQFTI